MYSKNLVGVYIAKYSEKIRSRNDYSFDDITMLLLL